MTWLLTVFLLLPDGTFVVTEVGMMNGRELCDATAVAWGAALVAEVPGIKVSWTCEDKGVLS